MWSDDAVVWRLEATRIIKICLKLRFNPVFDNFNANLHKKEGFLTSILYTPIPEYGQSNTPEVS